MPYRECRFSAEDGLSLYYRDYGDPLSHRTPVLCLGGLTRNSKDFHGLATWLSEDQGRRVVCPDYRGRGRSAYAPDWHRYNPATYLGDLRHLLAVAGLHRVVVVGTSLGGVMAMLMAVYTPGAVAGAVLNDIGPEINHGGLDAVIAYMLDDSPLPSWEAGAERLRQTFPGFPAETDEEWMAIAQATYREEADGTLRFDWDPAIVKPMLTDRGENVDLWPFFRALGRVPVLGIRGADSQLLTEQGFRHMHEDRPDLETVTVPGVGHAPSLGEPVVREALTSFLARVP